MKHFVGFNEAYARNFAKMTTIMRQYLTEDDNHELFHKILNILTNQNN